MQPSRGPREESIVNTIDQFLDENYDDVLRTSNIQTNFSLSDGERNLTGCPVLPLGWIVPDGTNQTLEEIKDKKISNEQSPGMAVIKQDLVRVGNYTDLQYRIKWVHPDRSWNPFLLLTVSLCSSVSSRHPVESKLGNVTVGPVNSSVI